MQNFCIARAVNQVGIEKTANLNSKTFTDDFLSIQFTASYTSIAIKSRNAHHNIHNATCSEFLCSAFFSLSHKSSIYVLFIQTISLSHPHLIIVISSGWIENEEKNENDTFLISAYAIQQLRRRIENHKSTIGDDNGDRESTYVAKWKWQHKKAQVRWRRKGFAFFPLHSFRLYIAQQTDNSL